MSGDVQPRKRKDKRRKKEGSSLGSIHEPVSSYKFKRSESDDRKIFEVPDQGEKIHVQNEHGIGGNICVKIIFFCLFGLLVGIVGLIYIKSLGSTDVDLPTIEESRFAEYFTGWLDDTTTDDHEHETVESNVDIFEHDEHSDHDDHDDPGDHDGHEDHEDHNDSDDHEQDHDDEEHENEDQPSVQDSIYKLFGLQTDGLDEEEESDKSGRVIKNIESGIMQDEGEADSEEKDEDDEEYEEDREDEEDEDDEVEEEEEKNKINEEDEGEEADNDSGVDMDDQDNSENEKDEDEDDLSQVDEEDEEKYSIPAVHKVREIEEVHEDEDEDEDDNKKEEKKLNINEEFDDNEDDDSDNKEEDKKGKNELEQENEEEKNFKVDDDNDLGYEEIDVSEEDLEENVVKLKTDQALEEIEKKSRKESDEEEKKELEAKQVESGINKNEEETETDFGGAAVKLGVGIALIIVAHLVLVKKWNSMTSPSDENASTEEIATEKKKIENLHSLVEPVISRRQTLVPENAFLNTSYEEEMDDEEEDEENEEDEEYSEEECEDELKTSDNWETFEKPSWNIKSGINEDDDEHAGNEEVEEEEKEEYEEGDVEEVEDEQDEEEEEEEEDYEDDDDDELDDDNDFVKQKTAGSDKEKQEVKEVTPAPPPRTKSRKGAQEVDEDFTNPSDEPTEVEETSRDGPKGAADDEANSSGPEEVNTSEKKVGNEDEWAFRQELEFADEQFENNPKAAVEEYNKIISKKPTMVRALIGRARALDHWAEKEKSNAHLKQAISAYKTLLLNHSHLLDGETYVKLAERCIERMRFAGVLVSAIDIHKALILKYPNTPKYRNTLAVTYLMLNKIPQARFLLNETLSLWPEDGFALVHYGFILKTSDNNMEEGAKKLMAGIQTRQEGVIDGMFFFHLGDALNRLGRDQEAMKWYELGVKEGLFLSKYQRSLYNVNRLKGQPWWTKEETTYQEFFKKLEDNWREIRKEGLELLSFKGVNLFKEEAENLKDTGDWKQLDLYFRGRKQANCDKAPITCSLVSSFKPASTCTRGQIKFSVMFPNTHVWPHCGPTNCRLRSHLGLVVPRKTFIRVAEETRSWEEGKFIIFDDSFEHEVWHNGTGLRLVLIVDVWHPELTNHERRYLSPI